MKRPLRAILAFHPSDPGTLSVAIGRDGGASRRERDHIASMAAALADALPAPLSATTDLREASCELRIHNRAARADFRWGSGDLEREGPLAAGLCAAFEAVGIERRGTLALADWAVRRYLLDIRTPLLRLEQELAISAIQDLRRPLLSYLRPGSQDEAGTWDFLVDFHSDLDPLSVALATKVVRAVRRKSPVIRSSGLFIDEATSLPTDELRLALHGLRARGIINAYDPSYANAGGRTLWEFDLEPGTLAGELLAKDLLTPPRPFGLSLVRETAVDPASGITHLVAVNVGRASDAGRLLASASPLTHCREVAAGGWALSALPVDCPDCLAKA